MKTNASRRRIEQDQSTLHLQRTVLSGTIMCLVAGMVASADTVDYPSPETVAGFFTHADTWTLQLLVGDLLILIAIGWVIRRQRPSSHRRVRRSIIDVALVGLVSLLLLGQSLIGLMSALGYGGGIDTPHLASAVLLIALPVVFVLVEYAHGQMALIMRVLRPGPLEFCPRPPSLANLVQRYTVGGKGSGKGRKITPTTNPAQRTALVAVAITTVVLLAATVALSGYSAEVQTAGVHRSAQR